MAHTHHVTHVEDPGGIGLPPAARIGAFALIAFGLLLWLVGFFTGGDEAGAVREWQSMLLAYMFFLMLGLGGVLFTAIQYCSSARWSIVVRRIAEGMATFIPVAFVIFLVIAFLGFDTLYHPDSAIRKVMGRDGVHIGDQLKVWWVSQLGMVVKGVIYYAIWFLFAQKIRGNSLKQDENKDASLFKKNLTTSIIFIVVFAYTFSLHCVDMLMALEPKWYSTMFGVYCFSGLLLSTYCVIALIAIAMRKRRQVSAAIQKRHMYDLGTWIMAFSCFMVYIGFSQYMLIWYANLPEETFYMIFRTENGWEKVFVLLPLLKWIIPFAVLMPQGFRANTKVLIFVSLAVLVGQWIDLYWMIYPVFSVTPVMPGLPEIGAFLALLGLFGVTLDRAYSRHSVLPVGDPYLVTSASGSYL